MHDAPMRFSLDPPGRQRKALVVDVDPFDPTVGAGNEDEHHVLAPKSETRRRFGNDLIPVLTLARVEQTSPVGFDPERFGA